MRKVEKHTEKEERERIKEVHRERGKEGTSVLPCFYHSLCTRVISLHTHQAMEMRVRKCPLCPPCGLSLSLSLPRSLSRVTALCGGNFATSITDKGESFIARKVVALIMGRKVINQLKIIELITCLLIHGWSERRALFPPLHLPLCVNHNVH